MFTGVTIPMRPAHRQNSLDLCEIGRREHQVGAGYTLLKVIGAPRSRDWYYVIPPGQKPGDCKGCS